MMFKITGRVVVKESQRALPGLIIKAYDKDLLYDDLLGNAVTDLDGTFEIVYEGEDFQELFEKKPDIYLKVKDEDWKDIFSTEEKVRFDSDKEEFFQLEIPWEKLPEKIREISINPKTIELIEQLFLPENIEKKQFLWQEISGAVYEISKIQTPKGEQILLNVIKLEGSIQMAEGSDLPSVMSPDDTLKAIAIEHLTKWTGQKYVKEIKNAIAGRESSTLYGLAMSYMQNQY